MGPDRSGAAIRRALRPSFLLKMWRTNPFRLYGVRTLLSGTLLPALPVGAGAPALLRQIADEGHEVALHGWDHVGWQDRIDRLAPSAIRGDLTGAARAVVAIFGQPPRGGAARRSRAHAARRGCRGGARRRRCAPGRATGPRARGRTQRLDLGAGPGWTSRVGASR